MKWFKELIEDSCEGSAKNVVRSAHENVVRSAHGCPRLCYMCILNGRACFKHTEGVVSNHR